MVFSAFVESVFGSDSRENLMGIWYAMATGCFLYVAGCKGSEACTAE